MPIPSDPTTELLTPSEVARLLKISKAGVYRLVDKRLLPFHTVMGSIHFEKNEVGLFLQHQRVEAIGREHYGSTKNK